MAREIQGPPTTAPSVARQESAGPGRLPYLTLPGLWGALIFACLSFTPSLLPRTGVIQGVLCGITAAIGYGLGVLVAWIWRSFADRDARRPQRRSLLIFYISAAVLYAGSFALGQYWQHEIRQLMGVTEYNIWLVVASPFIAAAVGLALLAVGRGVRAVYRWIAGLLNRWVGHRAANATAWILAAGVTYLVVSGVLLNGLVGIVNKAYSVRDTTTPEGVHQPTTALRSGGPGSLVPWNTLGYQGRKFVGLGPTVTQLEKFTGRHAMEPIRAYAGLASASSTQARADLAVADLERAGGFKRADLLVITTTGSGWVDPALIDSFEYMTGGDCAAVALQYSYLPSWISYLVDKSKAGEAGRDLFDAVYGAWSAQPPGQRPRLFVAGESLGVFGETARAPG